MPDHVSWHAALHGAAFFTSFISLISACLVFARRSAGLRRWAWMAYCVATAVAAPIIVALGLGNPSAAGIPMRSRAPWPLVGSLVSLSG